MCENEESTDEVLGCVNVKTEAFIKKYFQKDLKYIGLMRKQLLA